MRYFRKRQTQPANADSEYKKDLHSPTESMPLIHEDNRAFLKGKRQELMQPEEVLDNLAASIGITRSGGCTGCAGCASVFSLSWGVVIAATGTLLLVNAIASIFGWILLSPLTLDIALAALLLAFGMFFLMLWGPHYIMQPYLAERNWVYVTSLYNQLIAHGQIVEGTIIRIEQDVQNITLHYHFSVPSQCENCEGQYKLWTQRTFTSGQKVTVLYLNRCAQVLL